MEGRLEDGATAISGGAFLAIARHNRVVDRRGRRGVLLGGRLLRTGHHLLRARGTDGAEPQSRRGVGGRVDAWEGEPTVELTGARAAAHLARLGDGVGEPRVGERLLHREALGWVDDEQLTDQLLGLEPRGRQW